MHDVLRWRGLGSASRRLASVFLIAVLCLCPSTKRRVLAAPSKSAEADDAAAAALEGEIFGQKPVGLTQDGNCSHRILIQWRAEMDERVYSTPIILDIGGDGVKDVVVSTFRRHIYVLDGVYGEHAGGFPFTFPDSAFYASPIVYDINEDGEEDIGLTTFNGELIWVDAGGMPIFGKSIKLPHMRVRKDWLSGLGQGADEILTGETQYEIERRGPHQNDPRVWKGRNSVQNSAQKYHEKVWQAAMDTPPSAGGVPLAVGRRRRLLQEEDMPLDGEELVDGEFQAGEVLAEGGVEYVDVVDGEGWREGGGEAEEGSAVDHDLAGLRGAERDGDDHLLCAPTDSGWADLKAFYYKARPADEEEGDEDMEEDEGEEKILASIVGKDEVLAAVMGVPSQDLHKVPGRNASIPVPGERPTHSKFAYLDPHVLCTPLIADLDNDHRDEIIFAVSYYYEAARAGNHTLDGEPTDFNPSDFVAGALVVLDIDSGALKWETKLDLTTATGKRTAHLTASPTVTDSDWDNKLEIVVATSLGAIYVVDHAGNIAKGFPVTMDALEGQVAVGDIDENGRPEFVASDKKGNVAAYNMYGYQVWEAHVEGYSVQGPVLGDVDGDGLIEVVLATDKGFVYALSGKTGLVLAGFPVDAKQPIAAPPLLLSLPGNGVGSAGAPVQSIIVPTLAGMIVFVNGQTACKAYYDVGEASYSMVLAEDLSGNGRMDLLFTSVSGEVMALSTGMAYAPLKSWPSRSMGNNNLMLRDSYQGVAWLPQYRGMSVSGRSMVIGFEIVDKRKVRKAAAYRVRISVGGGKRLWAKDYYLPGEHILEIQCPKGRMHSVLTVEMINESGQHFEDSTALAVNVYFYRPLKWLLVISFTAMAAAVAVVSEVKFTLPRFRRYYEDDFEMGPPDPFLHVLGRISFMIMFIFVTLLTIFVFELEELIEARKHRKVE